MSDEAYLVCIRVVDMVGEPEAGSVRFVCSRCEEAIWLSPASRQMLASKAAAFAICMQCAAAATADDAAAPEPPKIEVEIAQLTARAEQAYDQMYEVCSSYEARSHFEMAWESLQAAARLAREAGLNDEAQAHEQRAQHMREVFRHQFMQPPDLTA